MLPDVAGKPNEKVCQHHSWAAEKISADFCGKSPASHASSQLWEQDPPSASFPPHRVALLNFVEWHWCLHLWASAADHLLQGLRASTAALWPEKKTHSPTADTTAPTPSENPATIMMYCHSTPHWKRKCPFPIPITHPSSSGLLITWETFKYY